MMHAALIMFNYFLQSVALTGSDSSTGFLYATFLSVKLLI